RFDPEQRPPDDPGDGPAGRVLHRHREPRRRRPVRVPRPAREVHVSDSSAVLEVRDLRVEFDTPDGVVHAADGVSYSVGRGRALGIVGESGSGKSVTNLTVMGLTRFQGARISGEVLLDGRSLLDLPGDEMRRLRGNEIAMIFQDPLSSLNP